MSYREKLPRFDSLSVPFHEFLQDYRRGRQFEVAIFCLAKLLESQEGPESILSRGYLGVKEILHLSQLDFQEHLKVIVRQISQPLVCSLRPQGIYLSLRLHPPEQALDLNCTSVLEEFPECYLPLP